MAPMEPGIRRGVFLRRAAVAGAGVAAVGGLGAGTALAGGSYAIGKPGTSLYDRVNRFSHLVCNVSDLERAKEFWKKWTPMRAYARTQTPQQAFPNLGISSGQFDGYLMRDMNDPGSQGQPTPGRRRCSSSTSSSGRTRSPSGPRTRAHSTRGGTASPSRCPTPPPSTTSSSRAASSRSTTRAPRRPGSWRSPGSASPTRTAS